jgi:FkbM family methyltransferase
MKQQVINLIQRILYKTTGFKLTKLPAINESIDCYTTVQALLKHHQPVHVCDVGSNTGLWFEVLKKYRKEISSVTFFEPQQKYQDGLKRFSPEVDTHLFKMGISDHKDTLTIKGGNACASFLDFDKNMKDTFTGELNDESETVPVDTLDNVYQENKLPQPDLLKIDVQGLELHVLRGAKKLLDQTKMVVIELSTLEFYTGQNPMWEILKYMEEAGFYLADIGYIWREDYDQNKKILQLDGIFLKPS